MSFVLSPKYLTLAALLFAAEVGIALFVKDAFVRPFVGDVLVVLLIYCFWRAFWQIDYRRAALAVFLLACLIEILQYFDYVRRLGLENNRILSTVMGRTFEWMDFIAYLAGFLLILLAENFFNKRRI